MYITGDSSRFPTPSWRSLCLWKGHWKKTSQKGHFENCQGCGFLNGDVICVIEIQLGFISLIGMNWEYFDPHFREWIQMIQSCGFWTKRIWIIPEKRQQIRCELTTTSCDRSDRPWLVNARNSREWGPSNPRNPWSTIKYHLYTVPKLRSRQASMSNIFWRVLKSAGLQLRMFVLFTNQRFQLRRLDGWRLVHPPWSGQQRRWVLTWATEKKKRPYALLLNWLFYSL